MKGSSAIDDFGDLLGCFWKTAMEHELAVFPRTAMCQTVHPDHGFRSLSRWVQCGLRRHRHRASRDVLSSGRRSRAGATRRDRQLQQCVQVHLLLQVLRAVFWERVTSHDGDGDPSTSSSSTSKW